MPCGKHSVVTSSHVNAATHNSSLQYGRYGCIQESNPVIMRATTLQQVIFKFGYRYFFCTILSEEFASFDREVKLLRHKELRLPAEEAIFQC